MMKRMLLIVAFGLIFSGTEVVRAQFHQRTKSGQKVINQNAVSGPRQTPGSTVGAAGRVVPRTGRVTKDLGLNENSAIIMTDEQRALFRNNNLRMGQQKDLQIDHWARSIQHSDGSYTETNAQVGMKFIDQVTKSKNGVILLRRNISLDPRGQPKEVLMYDGHDKYKYRGIFLYDSLGRFQEEWLYDTKGKPLRRKYQEYAPDGKPLPLKTIDYVEDIPDDLRLVVTRESELRDRSSTSHHESGNRPDKEKRPGFLSAKREDQPESGSQAQAKPENPKKRKGSGLGRLIFGRNK